MVGGCWLVVVGWWLLVGGCWLVVVGWWLLVGGCWLVVVGWWLVIVSSYLLLTLPIAPQPHKVGTPSPPSPPSYRGLTVGLVVFSLARLSAACLNNGSILFRQYSILGNFSG